jgi:PadR family transcriptional regulator PadR
VKNRVYLILLALADSDLHGLGIARAVQELSDGQTRLWPASLYGTLDELTESGWIEELDDPRQRPADESEKKRFYRLTRAGHRALAVETERLAALVKIAKSRLKPRAGDASTTFAKATVVK